MTEQTATTKEKATPKEKAAPKEKLIAGKALTTKIAFGVGGKDNKPYNGSNNNPKRGASAERFAKYKAGMTFQEALDAGISSADVKWDLEKGFIKAA